VFPLLGGVVAGVVGQIGLPLDTGANASIPWQYTPSTASTILATIIGATAALTGFVVTVTVLVVQMATGTFSARYMRLWYRGRMLKALLTGLTATLTLSFVLLRRVDQTAVPNLGVTVAAALIVLSILLFLLYLDRVLHRLRPVAVTALVAKAGRRAFEAAVGAANAADAPDLIPAPYEAAETPAFIVRNRRAGAIQAIHGRGLVRWARKHDCLLVLPHSVGDFVPAGAPLIQIYGAPSDPAASEPRLRGMVALGVERTIEQDPAFAIRIMVDIANLALSPAVNDPTTAVQVLDHLGDVLRQIGATHLDGRSERPGGEGRRHVLMPARRWDDFLALGVTEIREYGARAVQVNRRLRAMLEELRDEVLADHRPAVEEELARLDASVTRQFAQSSDLDRARMADPQGLGGPPEWRGDSSTARRPADM
jgi:uncharacterized membrane protein